MNTKDILDGCIDMMAAHLRIGSTVDLFKAMYPHPLDDPESIVWNIQQIDSHTAPALLKKLDRALMDFERDFTTVGENLMVRLRLENAIRMLTVLSKAKVPCEVKTKIRDEAFLWALTTMWTAAGVQWVYRTAQAFRAGQPSALPWPLPA